MKVLLTGGSGMLGQTIREICARRRPDLKILSPLRSELDLLDAEAIRRYLEKSGIEAIVHSAAKVGGIQANISDPTGFLYENALTSLNLIHAAASAGIRDLLYMGSSCMYPRDYQNPLREEYLLAAPLEPTNEGYALAKIVGAKLCEYYNRQSQTRFRVIIPCNLYGRYDNFDLQRGHLVASVLLKLHYAKCNREPSVTAWGDGSARREFLHCDDLAEFIADSIGKTEKFPDYLNLGYGLDFSVAEYYRFGAQVVGYEGELLFDATKPAGMNFKLMDSSTAAALGWSPKIAPLDGMSRMYDWFVGRL